MLDNFLYIWIVYGAGAVSIFGYFIWCVWQLVYLRKLLEAADRGGTENG